MPGRYTTLMPISNTSYSAMLLEPGLVNVSIEALTRLCGYTSTTPTPAVMSPRGFTLSTSFKKRHQTWFSNAVQIAYTSVTSSWRKQNGSPYGSRFLMSSPYAVFMQLAMYRTRRHLSAPLENAIWTVYTSVASSWKKQNGPSFVGFLFRKESFVMSSLRGFVMELT